MYNDTYHGYTFDAENHILQVDGTPGTCSTATDCYVYDGDGNRVEKKTSSPSELYWYGSNSAPMLETNGSGTLTKEYVFFGGNRIASRDSSSNVNYYVADHLGTARVVTNASGSILDDIDYEPYGVAHNYSVSSGNNYKFTGKERDTESGNDYFGARYYASSMGRFMSPDFQDDETDPEPVPWANFTNPQSMNLYSYVYNSPLSRSDRDGHDVNVCDNQGNCRQISNAQYQAAQQAGNGSLNVPTLDQVGMNGNGSGQFNSTAITDSSGQTVGSATYVSDGPTDYYANRNGINQIGQASATVGPIAGVVMGAVGIAMPGMFAADAAPAAAALAGVGRTGAAIANKLNHIFGKASHNLDGVVQASGGRQAAYEAMQNAAASATKGTSGPFEVTVSVGGENVVIRGTVTNGEVRIGTAWKQ